jgi:hypothetical protein
MIEFEKLVCGKLALSIPFNKLRKELRRSASEAERL